MQPGIPLATDLQQIAAVAETIVIERSPTRTPIGITVDADGDLVVLPAGNGATEKTIPVLAGDAIYLDVVEIRVGTTALPLTVWFGRRVR